MYIVRRHAIVIISGEWESIWKVSAVARALTWHSAAQSELNREVIRQNCQSQTSVSQLIVGSHVARGICNELSRGRTAL
jgi:hypothetical protein